MDICWSQGLQSWSRTVLPCIIACQWQLDDKRVTQILALGMLFGSLFLVLHLQLRRHQLKPIPHFCSFRVFDNLFFFPVLLWVLPVGFLAFIISA